MIFRLGVASARLIGAEVDTAFFNGNHAPHISVEAAYLSDGEDVANAAWEEVLPKLECGPSARFFFARDALTEKFYTHARLRMYPDGGIARFRLYGEVVPVFPKDASAVVDYAAVQNGGVAVAWSDQHFGSADNLLLPGRGHDMSDGWETKRSRTAGHVDWVIVKLGTATKVTEVVVDTADFKGNFPQKVVIKGINSKEVKPDYHDPSWKILVPESKTGPHQEHIYKLLTNNAQAYSHVSLTIIPDGGVKRIRVFGTRGD